MDLSVSVAEEIDREVAQDFESILRSDILSLTIMPAEVLKFVCDLLEGAKLIATQRHEKRASQVKMAFYEQKLARMQIELHGEVGEKADMMLVSNAVARERQAVALIEEAIQETQAR